MANLFKNITLPLAASKPRKFFLPHNIVCTQDFGYLTPLLCREMTANDTFNCDCRSFCRTAPLKVPTFADVNIDTHAFAIPLRQLWFDGENFFTQTTYTDPISASNFVAEVPKLNLSAIVRNWASAGLAQEVTSNVKYDYSRTVNSSSKFYVHTIKGKRILSILHALGYRPNFGQPYDSTFATDQKFSALPLLAYIHVYHEYYLPPMLYPNTDMQKLLNRTSRWWNYTGQSGQDALAQTILNCIGISTFLEQSYFNSAWQTPSGYKNTSSTYIRFADSATSTKDITHNPSTGLPTTTSPFTETALRALRGITNVVLRNSLAGNKYINRFLARYGVHNSNAALQRPEFLGSTSQVVQVSDVMCQATTEQAQTGDYAGKAISYGNGHFKYHADEPCYFMVLSTIQPRANFVQGIKREVTHTNIYDFFTPEFDKMGTQAIRNDEIFSGVETEGQWTKYTNNTSFDGVFGFVPFYSEYKVGYDNCFGDFTISSRNTGLDAYHLFRWIYPESFFDVASTNKIGLDAVFLSSDPSSPFNNFERPFTDTSLYMDNFVLTHQIDITAYRPMASLGDSLLPDEENNHNNSVTIHNGDYIQ